jgi:hypothetical protein
MSSKRAFVMVSQKAPPNTYGRNGFRGGAACKELEQKSYVRGQSPKS